MTEDPAEMLSRLEAADRRITPERVAERFRELLDDPGDRDRTGGERRPLLVVAPAYRWFTDWCRKEGISRHDAVYVHRADGLRGLGSGREVVIVDGYRCPEDIRELAVHLAVTGRVKIRYETALRRVTNSSDEEDLKAVRLVADLAWVAQGRCAACHVRLGDGSACPECGASWRAGCGDDGVPWLEKRSWMRCATWFIHGGLAGLAQDLLGVNAPAT